MKLVLSSLFSILLIGVITAQDDNQKVREIRVGLNYGYATQNTFPLDDRDYFYNSRFFKVQLNYTLAQRKKITYEIHVEPSIYFSNHRLLNPSFILPIEGTNYEEERARFSQQRPFKEYTLNIGVIARYNFNDVFSAYALGSSGPMILTKDTERLKDGFAFSNVFGLGFSYRFKTVVFDIRGTARHSSNANIQQPNAGHDSIGIESGISIRI